MRRSASPLSNRVIKPAPNLSVYITINCMTSSSNLYFNSSESPSKHLKKFSAQLSMQFSIIVASTIACAAAFISAQDFPNTCTFTTRSCVLPSGPTETITVYEQPFTSTSTSTFDCQGCSAVTVTPSNCYGLGLPITTTSFLFLNAQATTTVDVCSTTPATVPTDCPNCLPPK
ncbi:hypothetical protein N7G274_010073 [Stereocaulon virgatum]|uniref:Uncharacterized protein n=1 Tax=Stereocaulon virgatum TaxID=373712 RepID=A0ABR3ZVM9_9LECA